MSITWLHSILWWHYKIPIPWWHRVSIMTHSIPWWHIRNPWHIYDNHSFLSSVLRDIFPAWFTDCIFLKNLTIFPSPATLASLTDVLHTRTALITSCFATYYSIVIPSIFTFLYTKKQITYYFPPPLSKDSVTPRPVMCSQGQRSQSSHCCTAWTAVWTRGST